MENEDALKKNVGNHVVAGMAIIVISVIFILIFRMAVLEKHNSESKSSDFIAANSTSELNKSNLLTHHQLVVRVLTDSAPLLAQKTISDSKLSKDQVTSLKLLYMPKINSFIKTSNIEELVKAEAIKELIIKGLLRAEKKDNFEETSKKFSSLKNPIGDV